MQYTEDSIYRDSIRIVQPRKGYRFALDAVLLAHFLMARPGERLLEIGAGSGVVTVLLASMHSYRSVDVVEIQSELAGLCGQNFELNRVPNATVHEADIRDAGSLFETEKFDLIYSNPPYRKAGSGKLNPSTQKAIARHEIKMTLQDIFHAAIRFLKPAGRMTLILPEFRERDFRSLVEIHKFHIQEWKYVHSFATEPPAFLLATVGKSPAALTLHPSLTIYESPGNYTEEMKQMLGS